MGRPIKDKYFGVGGNGVATITNNNTATGYAAGTASLTISAPQLTGGTQAVATVTLNGGVTGVSVVTAGTGYTSAPTVTLTSVTTTGTTATFVASLASSGTAKIAASAWISTGSSAKTATIQKQESSNRYRVATADGVGICTLVSAAPAAGQMTITATDSAGGTYYVMKLTAHRALLVQNTGVQFANNTEVSWNLTAAVANTSVVISSN